MLGSLDCMQISWDMCEKSLHGQYTGKEEKPTIVLEAIADYNLYFHHVSVGYPGSLNDINVLNISTLIHKLTHTINESESESIPYTISDEEFTRVFYLLDGIYPSWSRFVKTIGFPVNQKQKSYSKWQEACRKDIERAFGVLQKRIQILRNGFKKDTLETINDIVVTCIIIHNMCVSERVCGSISGYKADHAIDAEDNFDEFDPRNPNYDNEIASDDKSSEVSNLEEWRLIYIQSWQTLNDPVEHVRLRNAITENVWRSVNEYMENTGRNLVPNSN